MTNKLEISAKSSAAVAAAACRACPAAPSCAAAQSYGNSAPPIHSWHPPPSPARAPFAVAPG